MGESARDPLPSLEFKWTQQSGVGWGGVGVGVHPDVVDPEVVLN